MSSNATSSPEDDAVSNFREYLRIPSVQPNVNYDECVSFLRRQASSLGLPIQVYHVVEGKPIVVITWRGTEPTLPSILLNSHMDVVPVYPVSCHRSDDERYRCLELNAIYFAATQHCSTFIFALCSFLHTRS
uniref:Aminoacylase-1 n=1 Tax=Timema genevievae TaxID=629358 RepID=A0A7R9JUK0_TIMGE|nr:unnamed protein product [Timema genevievae]